MANQPIINRRSNGWRRWLMTLLASLWVVARFSMPAMGHGVNYPTIPFLPVAEKMQLFAGSPSPSAVSDGSLARIETLPPHNPDTVVIPRWWPWAAFSILLIAVMVIAWMARTISQRKRGAPAIAPTDCQIKQIAERIGDVFWVGTTDYGRLDYVSSAYETIWGKSCKSLYNAPLSWTDSLFPYDRQSVMDIIATHQTSGLASGVFPNFRIVCPDGAIRWIHARPFGIDPLNTDEHRMVIIFQDITRNQFFEASLREADEKWRSLMENSPDYIMLMDLDGHIFFSNRAFLGLETSQLAGKLLTSLLSAKFAPAVLACLQTVVNKGRSDTCHVECREGGDRPLIFELRMGPVTVNGKIVAVAVNSTEITSRVQQEKALQESEAFHRTLFTDAPTGMCIQDLSAVEAFVRRLKANGVTDLRHYLMTHPGAVSRLTDQVMVVKVNQAMVELYHASDEKMVLGPLSRFFKKNERQHFVDQVVTLAGGGDCYEGEARNVDFRGHILHVIIRKVVVGRSENGLSKVLTSLIDVTPLKTAEKERELLMLQLQQAQKMEAIGTLAGGVAHDFNNILGIILGNVDLAMVDMPEDSPAFFNLREIESAVSRARDIVKQLLGFSRKSGQDLTFIHLAPVVEEAVNFLRATIPANIDIQTSILVDHDVICADSTHIHQIMINLCTNASHAMEAEGGQLSVRLENVTLEETLPGVARSIPPGAYLRLTVSDTGMGIDEEIKNRIFDPYFTTKETGKGTGMGLCMVQGIIKHSGGGITLDTTPGKGTRFALFFPLSDIPADAVSPSTVDMPSGSERILFVDDERLIVDLSTKMLNRLGYHVTSCKDADHALSLFDADPAAFDLVITDMTMPGMSGCHFIERIRREHPRLPVILCSGHIDRVSAEQIETLAISEVLAKPVSLKGLATVIRRTLDLHNRPEKLLKKESTCR